MEEFEKLYTVEDIAKMTSFTSRTIRNYLKDGSLQGRKIGGQWRFTTEDIKRLFDNSSFLHNLSSNNRQNILNFMDGTYNVVQGKVQVCAIVDCYCENPEAGKQIYEKLATAINKRDTNSPPVKFNYDFIENRNRARFTLFGNPDYIIETLQLL
jgi:excisionase family DNA binding protein